MENKKNKYTKGSIIKIPLRTEGYALGIITKFNEDGWCLGHFFEKIYSSTENIDLNKLIKEKITFVSIFSDTKLIDKKWKVIGSLNEWDSYTWSPPIFKTKHLIHENVFYLVYYNDQLEEIDRKEVSESETKSFFENGCFSGGAIEVQLTLNLDETFVY